MKMTAKVAAFSALCFSVIFVLGHCQPGNKLVLPQSAGSIPHFIHVFNGQNLGFYTQTGAFGFGNAGNSVLNLSVNLGATQQFVQNSNGTFYSGTSSCVGGCNSVYYFNGYSGSLISGSEVSSRFSLTTNGTSTGLALDPFLNTLFVADNVNKNVTFLKTSIPAFSLGGGSSTFNAPTGSSAQYVGADTSVSRIIVTENTLGSAFVMDSTNGSLVPTSPTTLSLLGGACASPSAVSYVVVNSTAHYAYVQCSGVVYFLNIGLSTPTFAFGSGGSSFDLQNIVSAKDMVYDSHDNFVIAIDGKFVTSISGSGGALISSVDVTTGDCGFAAADLRGLAYDNASNTLFVADAANNRVYLLNAKDLSFKNGICTKSSFATPDVPGPKRLTYF